MEKKRVGVLAAVIVIIDGVEHRIGVEDVWFRGWPYESDEDSFDSDSGVDLELTSEEFRDVEKIVL